jgi:hypothetical protein
LKHLSFVLYFQLMRSSCLCLSPKTTIEQLRGFHPQPSVNVGTSLGQRIQDPVASAQVAPATFTSFGAATILELSPNGLDSEQADNVNFVAELSKKNFAPTRFITSFQNSTPNREQAQSQLIGASIAPKTDAESSSKSADASQIIDGSFLKSLFSSFGKSSAGGDSMPSTSMRVENAFTQEWVGGFCRDDGTEVFIEGIHFPRPLDW